MSNAFTLSDFIYPLENEIVISSKLGISLDNIRTEKELLLVRKFHSVGLEKYFETASKGNMGQLNMFIDSLKKYREHIKDIDKYAYDRLNLTPQEDVLNFLCRNWIIIRYNDNGEFEKIADDEDVLITINNMPESYGLNYNKIESYIFFLSAVYNNSETFFGSTFLTLDRAWHIFHPEGQSAFGINRFLGFTAQLWMPIEKQSLHFAIFHKVKGSLVEAAELLEKHSSAYQTHKKNRHQKKIAHKDVGFLEKILFIGDILRMRRREALSIKLEILLLMTILEFFLSHKPDVDVLGNGIVSQLKKKISLMSDGKTSKKEIEKMYDTRSDIAHGNFITKSMAELEEERDKILKVVKLVIDKFVADPEYVDDLKYKKVSDI